MVVLHHFGKQVQRVGGGQALVLLSDERGEFDCLMVPQYFFQGCLHGDVVFAHVLVELLSAQDFRYLIELIVVVLPSEEGFSIKYLRLLCWSVPCLPS